MAGARRVPPVQIYQDPVTSFDHVAMAQGQSMPHSALQPMSGAPHEAAFALNPSFEETSGLSPLKTLQNASSSPPPQALAEKDLNSVRIPPPKRNLFRTDALQKRMITPRSTNDVPTLPQSKVMFSTFSSYPIDKENMVQTGEHEQIGTGHNVEAPQYMKHNVKHSLSGALPDVASHGDGSRFNRKARMQHEMPATEESLPDPSEMPALHDDGNKPSYSYAQLIGMAILRASNRRLTLAQIYKWISDNFKWYQPTEAGWQNSIRHNLSLNKAFIKQERPKDDPGKGNYWAIKDDCQKQFLQKDKPRRGAMAEGTSIIHNLHSDTVRPSITLSTSDLTASNPTNLHSSSRIPVEDDISSDATIPASDPAIHEGIDDQPMPRSRNFRSSPPPAEITSSPPPMPTSAHGRTPPPPALNQPVESLSGHRKRKLASFQGRDSGYWSSLESSQPRGSTRGNYLPSEVDVRPASRQRGRAEADIARLRSSSFDSPSKSRPVLKAPSGHAYSRSALPSSSPFRPFDAPSRAPLTPPVVFKRPARPPQSTSPNTNLRNHRKRIAELVGSPDKTLGILESNVMSPAPNSTYVSHMYQEDPSCIDFNEKQVAKAFEIFETGGVESPTVSRTMYADQRPSKRPRIERANTATGALNDITNTTNSNPGLFSTASGLHPFFSPFKTMPAFLRSPLRAGSPSVSPSKSAGSQIARLEPSPLKPGAVEFATDEGSLFGVSLHDEEDDNEGFDILQSLQKIGASSLTFEQPHSHAGVMPPPGRPSRPSLGRSTTSLF